MESNKLTQFIAGKLNKGADVRRIGQYVRNWLRWVREGGGDMWNYIFTDFHFAATPLLDMQ